MINKFQIGLEAGIIALLPFLYGCKQEEKQVERPVAITVYDTVEEKVEPAEIMNPMENLEVVPFEQRDLNAREVKELTEPPKLVDFVYTENDREATLQASHVTCPRLFGWMGEKFDKRVQFHYEIGVGFYFGE